ncbi:MAG: hypothetical protein IT349_21485 [Candidatus Eisenbacteria bacterium]|nr:hypothetical protein [Candidatus Eisenbacteria bacterium]
MPRRTLPVRPRPKAVDVVTIEVDRELRRRLKILAAEREQTLRTIVEEALEAYLAERRRGES